MEGYRKVIWAEGVKLSQQHFQRLEASVELERQNFAACYLANNFGVSHIKFDLQALKDEQLIILKLSGFIGNMNIIYDSSSDKALAKTIPENSAKQLKVYVGIPRSSKVTNIAGYDQSSSLSGYDGKYYKIQDNYDFQRHEEVLLAEQNIEIFFAPVATHHCLEVAVINLAKNNLHYLLCEKHISPHLKISAAANLLTWLRNLCGSIREQIVKLKSYKLQHNDDNLKIMLITNILGGKLALFEHIYKTAPSHHPQKVYDVCITLAGELAANLTESFPDIAIYDHQNLSAIFEKMEQLLLKLIAAHAPKSWCEIELYKHKPGYYISKAISDDDLRNKDFYFAIELSDSSYLEKINNILKVAAPSDIEKIVMSYTSGINIISNSIKDQGFYYFSLDKNNPLWQQIVLENKISYFVSRELHNAQLKLLYK